MGDGVWKGVYPQVFGVSRQLSLNKFFDQSTPSMRKGRNGGNGKRLMKIMATMSLPAVDSPNADRWNAACCTVCIRKGLSKTRVEID